MIAASYNGENELLEEGAKTDTFCQSRTPACASAARRRRENVCQHSADDGEPMQTRKSCIFCRQSLQLTEYFSQDKIAFLGHYCVAPDDESHLDHQIPFNVCICNHCQTVQNKYLGDLSVVYAHQHNQGIGEIYRHMHNEFGALILSNHDIRNVFEIGASIGTLSNIVLDGNTNVTYTIFEPNFPADSHPRRTVHRAFFEDCAPDTYAGFDTLVMSHVFEHFYDPMSVLDAVCESANLQHIYLCWPDLESYAHNNVLNVLTVEHTFYITADFLESVMASKGFMLVCMKLSMHISLRSNRQFPGSILTVPKDRFTCGHAAFTICTS